MTEPERVREKLWATEICDYSSLEKTKPTNEKPPPAFVAGGVLLTEYSVY
jgi:hypothetical protein